MQIPCQLETNTFEVLKGSWMLSNSTILWHEDICIFVGRKIIESVRKKNYQFQFVFLKQQKEIQVERFKKKE